MSYWDLQDRIHVKASPPFIRPASAHHSGAKVSQCSSEGSIKSVIGSQGDWLGFIPFNTSEFSDASPTILEAERCTEVFWMDDFICILSVSKQR